MLKFSPDGKQLLALGEALTPGADQKHFCKPTGVSAAAHPRPVCANVKCCSIQLSKLQLRSKLGKVRMACYFEVCLVKHSCK